MVGIDFDGTASPSSVSDTQGNTFVQIGSQLMSPEGTGAQVYYAKNIKGGADTVTIHFSVDSANVEIYLTEYYGLNKTTPIDAQAGTTGAAGAVSSGAVTTTVAGDIIYGYCVGDTACSVGSGFTARSTYDQNLIEDETAGSPGSYAATGTANNGWTMQTVALKPATPPATYVQAVGNVESGTAPSLSFLNNTAAGDLIMVGIDFDGTASPSSVSDTQGNTFVQVASQLTSPEGTGARVYYAKNIAGGPDTVTIHWSVTSANVEIYLTEYSGLNTTNPIDGQSGATGAAGAVSSGNVTTTVAGDIVYGYCVGDTACTVGTGFTARSTYDQNLIEDLTAGSPGSYAATATANNGWTMQMVALKPASSTVQSPVTTSPAASLSPTSLTFASQTVGATSAAQTITLNNTGNAALSITSIALTGTNPSDFAQTNTCGSSVAAGANCTISVTFTPTASGTRTAAVTLTDNATGSPQTVSLTGTGTAAVASLSPTSLTFASQAVGATSAAQTITLNNTGNAALTLTSIALTGTNPSDFAQTNTCGSSVAAGANCTISVTFRPTASGTRTAAVTLTDNATGSPQTVSLTGTGTAAVASLSPTSLTFASQAVGATSAAQTITLNNTGNAALTLTSIALTGTNPGDFAQTNTCGSSVAAGANCTISVTFTPTASGTRTAAVTLTDNATGSPQTVSLSGTGGAPAPSPAFHPPASLLEANR